jgi:hypothetical protein
MSEKTFAKSVTEIYRDLDLFKKISLTAIFSIIVLGFSIVYLIMAPTVVIMDSDRKMHSFIGERREVVVTENEIKKMAEDFIRRRFEWDLYTPSEIIANLSPIVTAGLKDKLNEDVKKQSESFKSVSQYVGKIQVTVDPEGNVIGVFDKILRITGNLKNDSSGPEAIQKIPLLSEAQVLLRIVRGSVTPENPLGIYINSVVSYEQN